MASIRVVKENDDCGAKRQDFANKEEIDEVQIEIDELLPTEPPFSGGAKINAKPNSVVEAEMEEGELSADELYDNNWRQILETGDAAISNHRGRRQPIQITIQNKEAAAKLPVSFANGRRNGRIWRGMG